MHQRKSREKANAYTRESKKKTDREEKAKEGMRTMRARAPEQAALCVTRVIGFQVDFKGRRSPSSHRHAANEREQVRGPSHLKIISEREREKERRLYPNGPQTQENLSARIYALSAVGVYKLVYTIYIYCRALKN